jgi:uncharacterized protein YdeI (YjbR/CyaY-like superfamily)
MPEIPVPHDLQIALHDDPEAAEAFAALPHARRSEYIDRILEARDADTRMRRVEQTVERLKKPLPRYPPICGET